MILLLRNIQAVTETGEKDHIIICLETFRFRDINVSFLFVIKHLKNLHLSNRWIGREGPAVSPARSPDLNSLDFYL